MKNILGKKDAIERAESVKNKLFRDLDHWTEEMGENVDDIKAQREIIKEAERKIKGLVGEQGQDYLNYRRTLAAIKAEELKIAELKEIS